MRALDPLQLKIQAVVNLPIWVLRNKLRFTGRAMHALNC